jgi:hypothetical protein
MGSCRRSSASGSAPRPQPLTTWTPLTVFGMPARRFGVVELERPGQCLQHDVEQFRRGMEVELEHGVRGLLTNVTDDDPWSRARSRSPI